MLRNLSGTVGVQIAVVTLSLVSAPLLARGLGADGRGQLAVVLVVGHMCAFLIDGGTTNFVIRKKAQGATSSLLLGSVLPILRFSVVSWIIASLPIGLLLGRGEWEVAALIAAQLCLAPVLAVSQAAIGLLLGDERWSTIATMRLSAAALPVASLLLLYATGNLTLVTATVSYFAATVLAAVPAAVLVLRAVPFERDRDTTRDAWDFGRSAIMTTLVTLGSVRADTLIVAQVLGFAEAGQYVLAATVASPPLLLAGAATSSLARRLSLDGQGAATAKYCRIVTTAVLALASVIAAAAPWLIPFLFGGEFAGAVRIAHVLLVGTVFGAAANFLSLSVSFAGHPKIATRGQLVGLIVMMVPIVPIGLQFGAIGCAACSATGYMATWAWLIRWSGRQSGVRWTRYVLPGRSDVRDIRVRMTRVVRND